MSAPASTASAAGRTTTRRRWPAEVMRSNAWRVLGDPGDLLLNLPFYVIVVVMVSGLWRAAADTSGGSVAGYSAVALTWYIATTEAATIPLDMRLIERIGRDVSSGEIAVEMLRPAPVVGVRMAAELGKALPRLVGCIVVGATLSWLVAGPPPRPAALLLVVPSLVLGLALNIAAQHIVAAVAFWIRDTGSAWFLYWKFVFVTGGMLIPLEVMPDWLHRVSSAMPFQAMTYVPARLAAGHVEPWLLVQQVGWLGLLLVAAFAVFGAGERRLQVVGG